MAHQTGALATKDLERVVVDTTVQPGPAPAKAGGDRPPDRCAAVPPRLGKAGRPGAAQRGEAAAELSPGGQARRDHGRPLQPRPSIQARQPSAEVSTHPAWPGDPRHPPQDRRRREAQGAFRHPTRPGTPGALPGPPPARPQGVCAARPRGRVHWQGQGPGAV